MTAVVRLLEWYVTLPDWAYVLVWAITCIAVMGGIVGLQGWYAHVQEGRKARRVVRNLTVHRLAVQAFTEEQQAQRQFAGYLRLYRAIMSGREEDRP